MAEERPRGFKAQVKGPLLVAAALAVAAFFAVFIFATGGTRNHPNLVLALGVAGAVFVVTRSVCNPDLSGTPERSVPGAGYGYQQIFGKALRTGEGQA